MSKHCTKDVCIHCCGVGYWFNEAGDANIWCNILSAVYNAEHDEAIGYEIGASNEEIKKAMKDAMNWMAS